MPTIEEYDNDNSNASSQQSNNSNAASTSSLVKAMKHALAHKIETAMWLTRLFTIFSAFGFFFPIFGGNQYSYYQKCLLSNAITSALRLHQRVPNFQLTRGYLSSLFLEDSAHYLIYSIIFLTSGPVMMSLLPLFLFATLHIQSYTKQLLDVSGAQLTFLRNLLGKLTDNQVTILRFIACNEIFIMPMIVLSIFTVQSSLFLPFFYYQFLSLRYSSRRNPYCKQLFYELRLAIESVCGSPSCPHLVRQLLYKSIALVCRLAPA